MALYFSYRIFVNQWANLNTFINAVTYGQPSDTLRQTLCKPVVDTGLHQKTVGTYTGLTGIAELGEGQHLHGLRHIRRVGDVAAHELDLSGIAQRLDFDRQDRVAHGDPNAPAATRQGAHRLRPDKARTSEEGHDAGGEVSHGESSSRNPFRRDRR